MEHRGASIGAVVMRRWPSMSLAAHELPDPVLVDFIIMMKV